MTDEQYAQTEDRLEQITVEWRRLSRLKGVLQIADRTPDPGRKLETLMQCYGYSKLTTILTCCELMREDLEQALKQLERSFTLV